ncbi:hypothetical protein ELZ21_17330, partial [Brucella abortus]
MLHPFQNSRFFPRGFSILLLRLQSGSYFITIVGTALTRCFVSLSYVSKRDQKSVQWTDFP